MVYERLSDAQAAEAAEATAAADADRRALVVRASGSFTGQSRERGRRCFREGKVALQTPSVGEAMVAAVLGSRQTPYVVLIKMDNLVALGRLEVHCDCPFAASFHFCKHIFATFLEIEASPPEAWPELALVLDLPDRIDLARLRVTEGDLKHSAIPTHWKSQLNALLSGVGNGPPRASRTESSSQPLQRSRSEIYYVVHVPWTLERGELILGFFEHTQKKTGEWSELKPRKLGPASLDRIEDERERAILAILGRTLFSPAHIESPNHPYSRYASYTAPPPQPLVSEFCFIPKELWSDLIPKLAATGRLARFAKEPDEAQGTKALSFDNGAPWRFELAIEPDPTHREHWRLHGRLARRDETGAREVRDLSEPLILLKGGLVVFADQISRLEAKHDFGWISHLRTAPLISFPAGELATVFGKFVATAGLPNLVLPKDFSWATELGTPKANAAFNEPENSSEILGEIRFDYSETKTIPLSDGGAGFVDPERRLVVRRNFEEEDRLVQEVHDLGVKVSGLGHRRWISVHPKAFTPIVRKLMGAGWIVYAHGHRVRSSKSPSVRVSSGMDWFDLEATFDFDGVSIELPELLKAARRQDGRVRLSDGSTGLVPEEWLAKFSYLLDLGNVEGRAVRYLRTQTFALDMLLAAQTEVDVDETYRKAREQFHAYSEIQPKREPKTFRGELRAYQREGLGWLRFLEDVGLGGCLADDMWLGKTVQVLALLESRRAARKKAGASPSIVVAPRSLVYNWIAEAKRFSPSLSVCDFTGVGRAERVDALATFDLIVTTYGTVRRDIATLKDLEFDYAIVDEAQTIKNINAQASKACRLLSARHRLALSGTPVENHLGELWSIFEFLNPRMLGKKKSWPSKLPDDVKDERHSSIAHIANALRPLILRRTKAQVLKELPPKTELTLHCELSVQERKYYNDLRDHFRRALDERIATEGMQQSKIHVLEALLRLRQAACHPGLIDRDKRAKSSAKLESLLENLREVITGGHKALVFSQFVQFLDIVRENLDGEGIPYAYLDGRTRDREGVVSRFQSDPDVKLFLISLKAGGHGLNITAADYVFILDPWWNPAVESQAVDRAHRMGQKRAVFAYRLISKDTIEEKVIALQDQKRDVANAIVSEDNSVLRKLTLADLHTLLE